MLSCDLREFPGVPERLPRCFGAFKGVLGVLKGFQNVLGRLGVSWCFRGVSWDNRAIHRVPREASLGLGSFLG